MRPSWYCASPSWGLMAAASSMRRKCWRLRMPAPRLENSPARKYHAKKIKKGDAIQRIRKSAGTHKKAAPARGIQERQTTPAFDGPVEEVTDEQDLERNRADLHPPRFDPT